MEDRLFRSSKLKLPSNPLCVKALARELKKELLGYTGNEREYTKVADAFYDRTEEHLTKTTWDRWWKDGAVPQDKKPRQILESHFPDLCEKWLTLNASNRLAIHLAALDLSWLSEHESKRAAYELAEAILDSIMDDWAPAYRGQIYLPSPKEREGVNWHSKFNLPHRPNRFEKDPRQEIEIGLIKGPTSLLSERASHNTQSLYESINPTSIAAYLLSYAVESRLPDPGLKQAFIFDLLTAVIALANMMQIKSPGFITTSGKLAQIFLGCFEFFWKEDLDENSFYYDHNHEFEVGIAHILRSLSIDFDYNETWALFRELKEIYYETLYITGLNKEELMSQVKKNL